MGGGLIKGTIPDVKVDPVARQETKQRIEIAQMNRTIKKMQNEITKLRRGDNYVENPRIPIIEQRSNPPQENIVRLENMDNPQISRVPRQPTPNAAIMGDVYDEKIIEQRIITHLMKVLRLCKMMDTRRPCINLKKEKTTLTHKKMSPRQEDL
jgi:hypothetical protein